VRKKRRASSGASIKTLRWLTEGNKDRFVKRGPREYGTTLKRPGCATIYSSRVMDEKPGAPRKNAEPKKNLVQSPGPGGYVAPQGLGMMNDVSLAGAKPGVPGRTGYSLKWVQPNAGAPDAWSGRLDKAPPQNTTARLYNEQAGRRADQYNLLKKRGMLFQSAQLNRSGFDNVGRKKHTNLHAGKIRDQEARLAAGRGFRMANRRRMSHNVLHALERNVGRLRGGSDLGGKRILLLKAEPIDQRLARGRAEIYGGVNLISRGKAPARPRGTAQADSGERSS